LKEERGEEVQYMFLYRVNTTNSTFQLAVKFEHVRFLCSVCWRVRLEELISCVMGTRPSAVYLSRKMVVTYH
jgi:hypothetical protein